MNRVMWALYCGRCPPAAVAPPLPPRGARPLPQQLDYGKRHSSSVMRDNKFSLIGAQLSSIRRNFLVSTPIPEVRSARAKRTRVPSFNLFTKPSHSSESWCFGETGVLWERWRKR